MPKRINPQDQWETDFQVPLPGEPRNIGPLETLFQRLLNRTERLKNRLGAILGLPWDATPPDTLAGLAGRVNAIEAKQGQPNGIPLLDSFGALASGNAYLDRGHLNTPIDWDTVTTAGVYRVRENAFGPGSANTPPAVYRYGVLLVLVSGIVVQQIFIPHVGDGGMYFRQSWDPTYSWSQWLAAGARYGFNSNGHFIRFADGTQICWASHDPTSFGAENTGGDPNYKYRLKAWVFPAAFAYPPVVLASSDIADFGLDFANVYSVTQAACMLEAGRYGSSGFVLNNYSSLAVGRWK
jgi:hypothetical protein